MKLRIRNTSNGQTRQVSLSLGLRLIEQGKAVPEPDRKSSAKAKEAEKPSARD